jgi:hypothetical protein
MKYEIFKTDTPELIAESVDSDYNVTFTTQHGMVFDSEPLSLVNQINNQNGTNFVGARPIRKPK